MEQTLSIVFDIGNVLMSWNPKRLLTNLQFTLADQQTALAQIVGHETWLALDRGNISLDTAVAQSALHSGLPIAQVHSIYTGVGQSLTLIEPVVQAAKTLKTQGYAIYILSNMPEPTWLHLESEHEIFNIFNGLLVSYKENLIKPEAAIFRLLTQRYNLAPHLTLFIDDHLPNIQAAQAQGWHGVHMADPDNPEPSVQALMSKVQLLSPGG